MVEFRRGSARNRVTPATPLPGASPPSRLRRDPRFILDPQLAIERPKRRARTIVGTGRIEGPKCIPGTRPEYLVGWHVVHGNRYAEHRGQRNQTRPNVTVAYGGVVGSPMLTEYTSANGP